MTKRSHSRAWLLCGAFAALVCATGDSFAQPTADPNKRATELYKKGNEFYDKSKWADAENMYRAAFDLRQTFDIAGNLGDTEMIMGKPREAAEHLSFAIRNFPADGKPAQREALRKRLQEAANLIGTVNVSVSVPGAEVLLDGKSLGKAPLDHEYYVDRGDHVIEAKMAGYEPAKESFKASVGTKHDIKFTLKEVPKPKAPPPPKTDEGGGIFAGRSLPILIAGGAVTVVGIAVGAGTAAAANGKASDADALIAGMAPNACAAPAGLAACAELVDTRKSQDTLANTSMAAFVVGGVAGLATAGYFFFWPKPKSGKSASVRPVPVVTANQGGLWVNGTF